MNIFIHSCHATLEHDQARMFKDMGHVVCGCFDVGNTQRKKIVGVTDYSVPLEEVLFSVDMILLHQCEKFPTVFRDYSKMLVDRKLRPDGVVVLNAFGQGAEDQHKEVVKITQETPNTYVVSYSITDHERYLSLGGSPQRFRLIRFGKYLDDYRTHQWSGRLPIAYVACNAAPRRGDGCGWNILNGLVDAGVPIVLGGSETESVPFGLGEIPHTAMVQLMSQVRCYVSLGTVPAPMTLSLIEALCVGCPVAAYDNKHGIANEDLAVTLFKDVEQGVAVIQSMLSMPSGIKSKLAALCAANKFDVKSIMGQWDELMKEVCHATV